MFDSKGIKVIYFIRSSCTCSSLSISYDHLASFGLEIVQKLIREFYKEIITVCYQALHALSVCCLQRKYDI